MRKEITFEFESEDREADVIAAIQDLAASIGWCIAYVDDDVEEMVDHLIIGTEPAIEEIDKAFQCYTVLSLEKKEEPRSH